MPAKQSRPLAILMGDLVASERARSLRAIHRAFNEAVDQYGREASRIVEDFAGAWYSKRRWKGGVDQTEGLAAVAMRKVADELRRAS